MATLNERLNKINRELNQIQNRQRRTSGVIEMAVQSDSRQQTTINLSYFVPNAWWYPSYDVRVDDVDEPLMLSYKANISQNTGVDWEYVNLTISSAQPRQNATIPSINPVYLQFYEPPRRVQSVVQGERAQFNKQDLGTAGEAGISQVSGVVLDGQTGEPLAGANVFAPGTNQGTSTDRNGNYSLPIKPNAKVLRVTFIGYKSKIIPITGPTINVVLQPDFQGLDDVVVTGLGQPVQTQLQQGQTAFSFVIDSPYSIKSDNAEKTVAVEAYTLPAMYEYIAIPKKQPTAFLTAKVNDWESLNLLPGETNLFLDDSYVGKSELNLNTVEDTLSFSLGKDEGINIERKQIESFREKNFFGNKVSETKGWDITVRNAKSTAVTITIIDQVPVSTNEDIEIDIKERSGAAYDKSTGKLKWQITLEPAEAKTLRFIYETTYPSGKRLIENQ